MLEFLDKTSWEIWPQQRKMTLGETHLSNDQSRQTLERLGQGGHSAVLLSPLRSAQSTALVSSGKALVRGLFTTHSPALRGLLQMSIGFLQRKTHPDFSLEGNKVEKARNKHLGGWNCIEPQCPLLPLKQECSNSGLQFLEV